MSMLEHYSHYFVSVSLCALLPLTITITNNSEDYYGDLDLKSIRKSELLAGLNTSQGRSSSQASAPSSKPNKPRPQANQNRPSPPPSQAEA
jgi:hypothetical protein